VIDWFILTVFVTLAWAVQSFLYKEGVRRKVEPFSMMFWMELPGMLACFIFLLATGGLVWHTLVFALAAVSGFLFAGRTYLRMEALKHLPLNVLYPILSFDVVLTVLASLWILKEHLGFYQILGLIIVLLVLFSYYREHRAGKQKKGFQIGLVLAVVVIVLSTIAALVKVWGSIPKPQHVPLHELCVHHCILRNWDGTSGELL
jgi:drug/metabolite transporter (DMT)-like permease